MKKLKLNLDHVQVISFTVEMTRCSGRTVNGFSPDTEIGCGAAADVTDFGPSCLECEPEPMSASTC
jgi:hypothetical protein